MNYKDFLTQQHQANKIHHAYIFAGLYFDKATIIDFIVQLLGASNEDVLKISAEGSISIDEIKALKKELSFAPFNSSRKIAIIMPADILTIEAQNALLKILEEPAEKSVIILFVEDEDRILPTIVSRCQRVRISSSSEILSLQQAIPSGLLEAKWSMHERFNFAEIVSKYEKPSEIIDGWLIQLSKMSTAEPKNQRFLDLINEVKLTKKICRSNANLRLVLENLMLKF